VKSIIDYNYNIFVENAVRGAGGILPNRLLARLVVSNEKAFVGNV